jgi:hypothetical protein
MRTLAVSFFFASACLLPFAAEAGPRNQGYTQLTGDQIRDAFSDHTFAAHGRPAMRFTNDGHVEGGRDARAWSVEGDTLCLTGPEQTCFDVWRKGREIQMFAGENDFSLAGALQ